MPTAPGRGKTLNWAGSKGAFAKKALSNGALVIH
jgi:hypothetical protein